MGVGEGPDVPVDPVLPPAGLVGVHHRTAPNPLPDAPQFTLGLPGHPTDDPDQGSHAQGQLMHGLQIPLNGAIGQPGLLPKSGNQADQVDPQPLFPQRHTRQIRPGCPTLLTEGTDAGDKDLLGGLDRNRRNVDDLPGPLRPAARQSGAALRAGVQGMLHPSGGGHALAGETVAPRPPRPPGLGQLPVGFGLETRHSPGAAGLGLSFQGFNPLLQLGDDRQPNFPGGGGQVEFAFHGLGLP